MIQFLNSIFIVVTIFFPFISSFENDYTSLKEFGFKDVVESVIKCISLIDNQACNELFVPPEANMAVQYKLSNQLSNICSELGFRGDLGYQVFLYCSEIEIRKVLSFLLEKILKDDMRNITDDDIRSESSVERLTRLPVSLTWIPPVQSNQVPTKSSQQWNCLPISLILNFKSVLGNRIAPNKRTYYDNYAKLPIHSLSSIIDWNSCQLNPSFVSFFNTKSKSTIERLNFDQVDHSVSFIDMNESDDQIKPIETSQKETNSSPSNSLENSLLNLEKELGSSQREFEELSVLIEEQIRSIKRKKERLNHETSKLIEMQADNKNLNELQKEVVTIKEEIESIQDKWSIVNQKLSAKLDRLKFEKGSKIIQKQNMIQELTNLRAWYTCKVKEMEQKDNIIQELSLKMKKPLPTNRYFYTKKIMEIVNNVKKQNQETKKILLETRQLQKDINIVSGKVQRAYTITDETIFKVSVFFLQFE